MSKGSQVLATTVHFVVFFIWGNCTNHRLAALDLGADVEQPFDCLIVQNPCSLWGGRWIGCWTTTWSTVCSAPHSHAAEEAISHLYKQERKRPTPVRRRLSRTQAFLGRVIPGVGCRWRGWKCGVVWGCPSTTHSIGGPPSAPHVCCCSQRNWWIVVRRVQMCVSIWGPVRLHSMDG